MIAKQSLLPIAALAVLLTASAGGQTWPSAPGIPDSLAIPGQAASSQAGAGALPLLDFHDSDIKFSLRSLMATLRDHGHEGWVLAAYPDPRTKRPLIGAGFSLDVQEAAHSQTDPLNPHPFVEPSSAQLWQAAGLQPERLQRILDRYDRDLRAWSNTRYRRKVRAHALTPELTDEEAMRLLRISAIQAIYNAKAYCRGFDQLTAYQQMAMSQLVFQMGVNLEEFVQFLGTINGTPVEPSASQPGKPVELVEMVQAAVPMEDGEHWSAVQNTLIDSQWAKLYTARASTVIAMFDPKYVEDPIEAQRRVEDVLRPIAVHHGSRHSGGTLRTASYNKRSAGSGHKKTSSARRKRRLS
jgi:hypothetical protein